MTAFFVCHHMINKSHRLLLLTATLSIILFKASHAWSFNLPAANQNWVQEYLQIYSASQYFASLLQLRRSSINHSIWALKEATPSVNVSLSKSLNLKMLLLGVGVGSAPSMLALDCLGMWAIGEIFNRPNFSSLLTKIYCFHCHSPWKVIFYGNKKVTDLHSWVLMF